jgi:hypothetical protein
LQTSNDECLIGPTPTPIQPQNGRTDLILVNVLDPLKYLTY